MGVHTVGGPSCTPAPNPPQLPILTNSPTPTPHPHHSPLKQLANPKIAGMLYYSAAGPRR